MTIRWFVKVLPYFIIEKLILRFNYDFRATLYLTDKHSIPVTTWAISPGVWIVKSQKVVLERNRAKLESKIADINAELDDYTEED